MNKENRERVIESLKAFGEWPTQKRVGGLVALLVVGVIAIATVTWSYLSRAKSETIDELCFYEPRMYGSGYGAMCGYNCTTIYDGRWSMKCEIWKPIPDKNGNQQ